MADEPITREDMLNELIAALRDTDPPEDAFSVDDIMAATGWSRDKTYSYLRRGKETGKIEIAGRYGAFMYYRLSKQD